MLFYAGALLLSLFNYAVGERTGVLSKISRKGVACWTTEGELAQPSFSKSSALRSGGAPIDNTFYFSVPNPNVRDQLAAVPPGASVSLQYEQKLFALDLPLPLLCRRRTQFRNHRGEARAGLPAGGVPGQAERAEVSGRRREIEASPRPSRPHRLSAMPFLLIRDVVEQFFQRGDRGLVLVAERRVLRQML